MGTPAEGRDDRTGHPRNFSWSMDIHLTSNRVFRTGWLTRFGCSEFGTPLFEQLSSFFRRDVAPILSIFDPAINAGQSFGIHLYLFGIRHVESEVLHTFNLPKRAFARRMLR